MTADGRRRGFDLLVWLGVAGLIHVILFGGFTLRLGSLAVSAHDPWPVVLQVAVVFVIRRLVRGTWLRGLSDPVLGAVRGVARVATARRPLASAVVLLPVAGSLGLWLLLPAPGLTGRYFDNPDWSGRPFLTVRDREPNLVRTASPWFHDNFSVEWTGVLEIERAGDYLFVLESDDGATLVLDDEMVVDNSGPHSVTRAEGIKALQPGFHPIRVRFVQTVGGFALRAAWNPVGVSGIEAGERSFTEASLYETAPVGVQLLARRVSRVVSAVGGCLVALLLAGGLLAFGAIGQWMRRVKRTGPGARVRALARSSAQGMARRRVPVTLAAGAVALAAAGSVAIDATGRGMTARYFSTPKADGTPVLVTRDPFPRRDRLIYDFSDPDGVTSVIWSGMIHLPAPGDYHFAIRARTPARLSIAGQLVVEHTAAQEGTVRGSVRLAPGFHSIRVEYRDDRNAGGPFEVQWGYDSQPLQLLSTATLLRASPDRSPWVRRNFELAERIRSITWPLVSGLAFVLGGLALVRIRRNLVWPRPSLELAVHGAVLAAVSGVFIRASSTRSIVWWGFAKPGWFEPFRDPLTLAVFGCILLFVTTRATSAAVPLRFMAPGGASRGRQIAAAGAFALGAASLFFALRNGFVNIDGTSYRWMIPEVVTGSFTTSVDEMLERQVHAWWWQLTHALWGWSVRSAYQVASAAAGAVFLLLLWPLAKRLAPGQPALFALLVLGGGYLQLFFGEVEHYSLVAVASLAYILLAVRHLQGEVPLALPAAALALAMSFHMLAGFLGLSLLFLVARAIRVRAFVSVLAAGAAAAAVLAITVFVVDLPLAGLYQGSAGTQAIRRLLGAAVSADAFGEGEVNLASNWAFFAFDEYHWNQYNLLALLIPAHLVLLPLAIFRRVQLDPINGFLAAASLGMVFFHFNYRAMLPIAHDWNLFANAALPVTLLLWRSFLGAAGFAGRAAITLGWLAVSWLSTLAWILANHRHQP